MKRFMKIVMAMLVVAIGVGCCFAACGDKDGDGDKEIRLSGSSSISPLMQKLGAAYEEANPGVKVRVTSSDSGTGIADTLAGKNDIGMASRALKDGETGLVATKICDDGVVLIVNNDVTLADVTSQQVYDLYANGTAIGAIVNAVSREEGSGTRDAFDDLIKNADGDKLKELTKFADCVSIQRSTGDVKVEIAASKNAVGYISLGSLDDTVKGLTFNGVAASAENIKNGTYTLARPFNILTKEGVEQSAEVKAFIEWLASDAAKAIMTEEGYVV